MTTPNLYSGPTWDLTCEYDSPNAPAVLADIAEISTNLNRLQFENQQLVIHRSVEWAQQIFETTSTTNHLIRQLRTYANCLLSVDGQEPAAQKLLAELQPLIKTMSTAQKTLRDFLLRSDEQTIAACAGLAPPRPAALGHVRWCTQSCLPPEISSVVLHQPQR